jgi:hypothetical protein
MNDFLKTFQSTWECDIKARFHKGLINYERQLQSILYNQLRVRLTNDFEIYIEPVFYQLEKIKPDMVITKANKIIAIIELKSKPWEYPTFFTDMKKLERFRKEINVDEEIVLGWIPKSADWYEQDKYKDSKLCYKIDQNLLLIMALITRYDSDVVTKEAKDFQPYTDNKNFYIFLGYIDQNKEIVFKRK